MSVELLDEDVDDVSTILTVWLTPLLVPGQVSYNRRAGDPLPFIWHNHLSGDENVEESSVIELVSIHYLHAKGDGGATVLKAFKDGAKLVHRRMLLLARELPDIELPDGRMATIDFCDVFSRPVTQEYGDEQILQKVGRYRLGLSYVKLP